MSRYRPEPIKLLSPKWAKEDAPQKEDWEKRLDQTVHSVCPDNYVV
jgi:hypothetical protein